MANPQHLPSVCGNGWKTSLPEQIDDILNKLYIYRSQIKGDFEQKVEAMNKVTENLIEEHD